ncbi:DUF3800 domain-containing protein [Zavarzinia aquatilis]|uniref:DUF3800 domain-containing protein n=1 Tax=Zavarzinia aquatilis TaxID=2211142 RepID=A0A317EBP5_9PROT|nr:DUF3800 domain-containing protein [Zavarzinia aquatilis]PWR24498.1 DUF3800 domain-containing protein [Zavarzinia aquatilis]
MTEKTPEYGYLACIDEAGDPGLKKVRPIDPDGASEWLMLSAVVMRAKWENDVVAWVDNIRTGLGIRQRRDLHYRTLSPTRKIAAANAISRLPLRGFVICSNKKNMRGHENRRAAKIPSQEWFYNFCLRLLLERVTEFCALRTIADHGRKLPIKIEFSRRGGHRYSQTRAYSLYLDHQRKAGSTFLEKRLVRTDMLNTDLMEDHPHDSRAGLQLADIIASAFYQAADCLGPGSWDADPAKALARIMATEKGSQKDFGVCLQPTPPWKANLTAEQQRIFEYYGYNFARW